MLTLNIGEKEYNIEFTIEASLYSECTERITGLLQDITEAQEKENIKEMISKMSDIPQTTLTMFYAGLLEHHGEDGDGTVLTKKDAKRLIKEYMAEHKDDETGNFYGVMVMLIDQMGEDGFFKQIGLQQAMTQTEETEKKPPKTPQDHKPKNTKTKSGEK